MMRLGVVSGDYPAWCVCSDLLGLGVWCVTFTWTVHVPSGLRASDHCSVPPLGSPITQIARVLKSSSSRMACFQSFSSCFFSVRSLCCRITSLSHGGLTNKLLRDMPRFWGRFALCSSLIFFSEIPPLLSSAACSGCLCAFPTKALGVFIVLLGSPCFDCCPSSC